MINILVLCTGNSCRSQIAHGFLEYFSNKEKTTIYSAGIETHGVNVNAIATMKRKGIDISHHTSNHINEYELIQFDYVITVCDNAKESCPVFFGNSKKTHHNFTDPAKAKGTETEIKAEFDKVRDQIEEFCKKFILELSYKN